MNAMREMNIFQQEILHRLGEFGWVFSGREESGEWWIDDIWRIRSIWSPTSLEVFLVFLVDPQADIYARTPGEDVWAVSMAISIPLESRSLAEESMIPLGRGWKERIPDLFVALAALRNTPSV